jgi:hypothetical protein
MATEWSSLIHRMQRDRDNAKQRQGARKEIEFGLETYEELYGMDLKTYRYLMSKECSPENDKWRKLELQWADYD